MSNGTFNDEHECISKGNGWSLRQRIHIIKQIPPSPKQDDGHLGEGGEQRGDEYPARISNTLNVRRRVNASWPSANGAPADTPRLRRWSPPTYRRRPVGSV